MSNKTMGPWLSQLTANETYCELFRKIYLPKDELGGIGEEK